MTRDRIGSRGFALIEVLIATSLLAMLSIIIFVSIRSAFRLWERSSGLTAGTDEIVFAQGFLRRSIEGAYPWLKLESGTVDFEGTETRLEFQGPTLAALSLIGRSRLAFSVVEGNRGHDLVAEIASEFGESPSQSERVMLFEAAESIRFSYRSLSGDEWTDDWTRRASLPALVRIEIDVSPDDRRRWPTLIIQPEIDADVDCRFDPLTLGCRGRRRE